MALEPTPCPVQWVLGAGEGAVLSSDLIRPQCEAEHLLQSSVNFKAAWTYSYNNTSPHVFMQSTMYYQLRSKSLRNENHYDYVNEDTGVRK